MTKIYKGNTPELYELFIKGEQIQYQSSGEGTWKNIPKYNGKPNDVYRVAGDYHNFRVKPKDVITKVYMHYDRMEKLVQEGTFYGRTNNQMIFDNPKGMNNHLEFTFTNGKLTKVKMKGPTRVLRPRPQAQRKRKLKKRMFL